MVEMMADDDGGLIVGEMYPLRIRGTSAGIATTGNWLWNFMLTFFTPLITKAINYEYGYVFAGCNAIAVLIVFFFYYESAGLTLEQVDLMYNDPKVKPWTSQKYVDAAVERRRGEEKKREMGLDSGVHGVVGGEEVVGGEGRRVVKDGQGEGESESWESRAGGR